MRLNSVGIRGQPAGLCIFILDTCVGFICIAIKMNYEDCFGKRLQKFNFFDAVT